MTELKPKNLNNMNGNPKWYFCKRDLVITLILMVFSFFLVITAERGYRDAWPITLAIAVVMLFVESMIICRRHFWAWTVVASISITSAIFVGLYVLHPFKNLTSDTIVDVLGNAMMFLTCFLPIGIIVFLVRRKLSISQ